MTQFVVTEDCDVIICYKMLEIILLHLLLLYDSTHLLWANFFSTNWKFPNNHRINIKIA